MPIWDCCRSQALTEKLLVFGRLQLCSVLKLLHLVGSQIDKKHLDARMTKEDIVKVLLLYFINTYFHT